jgi:hypothetical protein
VFSGVDPSARLRTGLRPIVCGAGGRVEQRCKGAREQRSRGAGEQGSRGAGGAEEQRSLGAEVNLLCTPAPVLPCTESTLAPLHRKGAEGPESDGVEVGNESDGFFTLAKGS